MAKDSGVGTPTLSLNLDAVQLSLLLLHDRQLFAYSKLRGVALALRLGGGATTTPRTTTTDREEKEKGAAGRDGTAANPNASTQPATVKATTTSSSAQPSVPFNTSSSSSSSAAAGSLPGDDESAPSTSSSDVPPQRFAVAVTLSSLQVLDLTPQGCKHRDVVVKKQHTGTTPLSPPSAPTTPAAAHNPAQTQPQNYPFSGRGPSPSSWSPGVGTPMVSLAFINNPGSDNTLSVRLTRD